MSPALRKVIDKVPAGEWLHPVRLEGGADVAETTYKAFGNKALRLIVRRVKPTPGSQLARSGLRVPRLCDRPGGYDRTARGRPPPARGEEPGDQGPERRALGAHALWPFWGERCVARLGGYRPQPGPLGRTPGGYSRPGRAHPPVHPAPALHLSARPPLPLGEGRTTLHLVKGWPGAEAFLQR